MLRLLALALLVLSACRSRSDSLAAVSEFDWSLPPYFINDGLAANFGLTVRLPSGEFAQGDLTMSSSAGLLSPLQAPLVDGTASFSLTCPLDGGCGDQVTLVAHWADQEQVRQVAALTSRPRRDAGEDFDAGVDAGVIDAGFDAGSPPIPCTPLPLDAGGPHLAFLTSELVYTDFGGLDSADRICNRLAADAGLPGVYRAWLSDSECSPAQRFTRSLGPYVLPSGVEVAASWADLVKPVGVNQERIKHAFDEIESGAKVAPDLGSFWSNTTETGEHMPQLANECFRGSYSYCQNWTVRSYGCLCLGLSTRYLGKWSCSDPHLSCNPHDPTHLLCFQQ